MIPLIILSIITYFRTLWNGFISDDITVHNEMRIKGYPIRWKENIKNSPFMIIHDLMWRWFKDNAFYHHSVNLVIFVSLVCSIYFVGCKFLPKEIMFLATIFFIVHPCNCQSAGWISGRYYMVAFILGAWALYFNSIPLYLLTAFCHPIMFPLPLLMKMPVILKVICMFLLLRIYIFHTLDGKIAQAKSEGWYKRENLKLYPRKLIVMVKSFAYYFTLAFFPVKMGWFHELGEPIDDKIKFCNTHFFLACLLIICLFMFIHTPVFMGIMLFAIFIAPFTNLITFALFTSERYMSPAIFGWSIFLAYTTISYPIIATVIITIYFMRTQLELWAYRDDFTLALYSLLNFPKSGFAWCNLANIFLSSCKPSAAYDTLREVEKRIPEFPTTYYQLYLMYRAEDLLNDFDVALINLEKACRYGKHTAWYKELDDFKMKLKSMRIERFKENVARNTVKRQYNPAISEVLVGASS